LTDRRRFQRITQGDCQQADRNEADQGKSCRVVSSVKRGLSKLKRRKSTPN
jgi:hypothetical protein